ncbi:hypothetical protein L3Q67_26555 [Saccharothrix sp. AJ9571]|nr:hypothetical protein L3Q67_26555 [Saccharothrix sp. AJ9571]
MANNIDANLKAARDNIARIKADVEKRDDARVWEEPFGAALAIFEDAGQGLASGCLSIAVGKALLHIDAGRDAYSISGADCGSDWSLSTAHQGSRNEGGVPAMDDNGVPVSTFTTGNSTWVTSSPYSRPDRDRDGHKWLRDYVNGWITGHA